MYYVVSWAIVVGCVWWVLQKYDYLPFYIKGVPFPAAFRTIPLSMVIGTLIWVILLIIIRRYVNVELWFLS